VIELERALVDLGRRLEVPEPPDLAPAVLARLERPAPRRPVRRLALAVALVLAAALLAALAIPEARSALLRVLRLGGEQIVRVDELPPVEAADLETTLGERVTLEEARARAGFEPRVLDEPPTGVYLGDRGTVWLLYGDTARPRLLVAQTPRYGVVDEFFVKKLLTAGSSVEPVTVRGSPGLFVSGEPHLVVLLDETGAPVEETARLARDVLVWEEGGVAYRLEGDLTVETALELARELR